MNDHLSDVDLTNPRFLAEFPDGKVPIKALPSRFYREWTDNPTADDVDLLDFLFDLHEELEAVEDYDTECLSELTVRFMEAYDRSRTQGACAARNEARADCQEAVSLILGQGLSLRQTARFLGLSDSEMVDVVLCSGYRPRTADDVESILIADEVFLDCPETSIYTLSRELGWPGTGKRARKIRDLRLPPVGTMV